MEEVIIGAHVSFKNADQLVGSVKEALSYGANTFMIYTGAPQNTRRMNIDQTLTDEGLQLMKTAGIQLSHVIAHAPYIVNLANHGDQYDFSIRFMKEEIRRTERLGITKMVLHPGSHVGLGEEAGIANIIEALNLILKEDMAVQILLETMAGKGSELGKSFEQLGQIIAGVDNKERIGVCMDTCHMHDAGYDITKFDQLLDTFDQIVGLSYLGCVHVNDSKNERQTHKDRHENIGCGHIGFDALLQVIYHDKLKGIPKILETPYIGIDDDSKKRIYPPYRFEIKMIQKKEYKSDLKQQIRTYYK